LPIGYKREISRYINYYHGATLDENFRFIDIVTFLPDIFKKISGNLERNIKSMRKATLTILYDFRLVSQILSKQTIFDFE
jgi:hypothetical protein